MKKSYLQVSLLALVFGLATPVFAQYTGPQQKIALSTVAVAAKAGDKTHVVLEGVIASRIRDEHYTFKDATGTIEIEIDAKYFPATPVNENTRLRIHGKVDKNFGKDATVDVKQVDILQ